MDENWTSQGWIELAPGVRVPGRDVQLTFVRGQGPGGQAVNKVSSTACLRVPIAAIEGLDELAIERLRRLAGQRCTAAGEILLRSQLHRSQLDNRRACFARLRDLVRRACLVPKPRKATRPTRGAVERRLRDKRQRSERKRRRERPSDDN